MTTFMLILLVRLIATTVSRAPCPEMERQVRERKLDEPIVLYGCTALHWNFKTDTSYVSMEYIRQNFAHPRFSEDSSECHVKIESTGIVPSLHPIHLEFKH